MIRKLDSQAIIGLAEVALGLVLSVVVFAVHVSVLQHAGAMWRDEVNTINLASLPSLLEVWQRNYVDSFPVLWPFLVHGWIALGPGETDFGLRILGLTVGSAITAMLWWNAWRFGHGVPLISLPLVGLSSAIFQIGDSMRAYGLALILVLLSADAVWKLVFDPRPRRAANAVVAAILSVQCLFLNAVPLMAVCAGSGVACLWRRSWKSIGVLAGVGLIAAASLLLYVPTFARHREWSEIAQIPVQLGDVYTGFEAAVVPFSMQFWLALIATTFAACCYRLFRSIVGIREGRKELPLFILTTMTISLVCYSLLLKSLRVELHARYYLPVMGLAAVLGDAAVHMLIQRSLLGRAARIVLVALFSVLLWSPAWQASKMRQTNVDLLAAHVQAQAAPDDLIVVYPWQAGVTFARYYSGSAPWMTLPDFDEHRFQSYPLFRDKMAEHQPIQRELTRMRETLKAGRRVWLVGGLKFPLPGEEIEEPRPAVRGISGWQEPVYTHGWSYQAFVLLKAHDSELRHVAVPAGADVSTPEDLPLWVAKGWSEITQSSGAVDTGQPVRPDLFRRSR
jgi:hypothetical protein